MKRNKHLPLTETVYYILLVLFEPAHGYLIMQKVEELSQGEVRMAAGTLYGAIENLLKWKFIKPVEKSRIFSGAGSGSRREWRRQCFHYGLYANEE